MTTTNFQDYNQNTPIVAAWLNDVNGVAYSPAGVKKTSQQSAAAFVRFSVAGAVATIQQSVGIASVVRTGLGVYLITYSNPMTAPANCYSLALAQIGIIFVISETATTLTIGTTDLTGAPIDATFPSVTIFGSN